MINYEKKSKLKSAPDKLLSFVFVMKQKMSYLIKSNRIDVVNYKSPRYHLSEIININIAIDNRYKYLPILIKTDINQKSLLANILNGKLSSKLIRCEAFLFVIRAIGTWFLWHEPRVLFHSKVKPSIFLILQQHCCFFLVKEMNVFNTTIDLFITKKNQYKINYYSIRFRSLL